MQTHYSLGIIYQTDCSSILSNVSSIYNSNLREAITLRDMDISLRLSSTTTFRVPQPLFTNSDNEHA